MSYGKPETIFEDLLESIPSSFSHISKKSTNNKK